MRLHQAALLPLTLLTATGLLCGLVAVETRADTEPAPPVEVTDNRAAEGDTALTTMPATPSDTAPIQPDARSGETLETGADPSAEGEAIQQNR